MREHWRTQLDRRGRVLFTLAGIAVLLFVVFIDYATGDEVSTSILYLVPVAILAWGVGAGAGLALSFFCAGSWVLVNFLVVGGTHKYAATPYWNGFVLLLFFLAFAYVLGRLKKALDVEKLLSETDPLTGVNNRRYFYEAAAREFERSRRYGHPVSLVYLDLDNFKQVNDRHGHEEGDRLLRQVAGTIREHERGSDVLARMGGDEFAVLLPETGPESAAAAAAKVLANVRGALAGHGEGVTASVGVVTYETPPASVDDAVEAADRLMYEVKKSTKDAFRQEVLSGAGEAAGREDREESPHERRKAEKTTK